MPEVRPSMFQWVWTVLIRLILGEARHVFVCFVCYQCSVWPCGSYLDATQMVHECYTHGLWMVRGWYAGSTMVRSMLADGKRMVCVCIRMVPGTGYLLLGTMYQVPMIAFASGTTHWYHSLVPASCWQVHGARSHLPLTRYPAP